MDAPIGLGLRAPLPARDDAAAAQSLRALIDRALSAITDVLLAHPGAEFAVERLNDSRIALSEGRRLTLTQLVAGVDAARDFMSRRDAEHAALRRQINGLLDLTARTLERLDADADALDARVDAVAEGLAAVTSRPLAHLRAELADLGVFAAAHADGWAREQAALASGLAAFEQSVAADTTSADPLTGALPRAAFTAALHRSSSRRTTLVIGLVDIDGLAGLNARAGQAAGDAALQTLAGVLAGLTRRDDVLARYGSDTFALLLRDVPLLAAHARMASALAAFGATPLTDDPETIVAATASAGLTDAGVGDTPRSLVHRADHMLRTAKRHARGHVLIREADYLHRGYTASSAKSLRLQG